MDVPLQAGSYYKRKKPIEMFTYLSISKSEDAYKILFGLQFFLQIKFKTMHFCNSERLTICFYHSNKVGWFIELSKVQKSATEFSRFSHGFDFRITSLQFLGIFLP